MLKKLKKENKKLNRGCEYEKNFSKIKQIIINNNLLKWKIIKIYFKVDISYANKSKKSKLRNFTWKINISDKDLVFFTFHYFYKRLS